MEKHFEEWKKGRESGWQDGVKFGRDQARKEIKDFLRELLGLDDATTAE